MSTPPTRLWVRSDHLLFADGLIRLLQEHGYEAQRHPQEAQLGLHDLCFSPIYPLVSPLARPSLPILALVGEPVQSETLVTLLRSGYRGYMRPLGGLGQLLQALEALSRGEMWAERAVLMQALAANPSSRLTTREQEILHYLRRGWSNAEIASHLGISVKTVKTHVSAVFAKVGARDRVALIAGRSEDA